MDCDLSRHSYQYSNPLSFMPLSIVVRDDHLEDVAAPESWAEPEFEENSTSIRMTRYRLLPEARYVLLARLMDVVVLPHPSFMIADCNHPHSN